MVINYQQPRCSHLSGNGLEIVQVALLMSSRQLSKQGATTIHQVWPRNINGPRGVSSNTSRYKDSIRAYQSLYLIRSWTVPMVSLVGNKSMDLRLKNAKSTKPKHQVKGKEHGCCDFFPKKEASSHDKHNNFTCDNTKSDVTIPRL